MYLQKNINYLLNKNELSYREVSAESGVSIRAISFIVNNDSPNVTLNTVMKLAKYFNVSLDAFVYKDLSQENERGNER